MRTAHLTVLAVTLVLFLLIRPTTSHAAPPKRAGSVALVNGQVIITSGSKTFPAEPGSPVYEGDRIKAFNPAKAKIVFADDTIINIGHDTEFTVRTARFSLDKRESFFDFAKGRFKVAVGKFFTGSSDFTLKTQVVVAGVRGTVFWGDTDVDAICTLNGEIEITPVLNESAKRTLKAGECVAEFKAGKATPISPTAEAVKGYIDEVTPQ